MEWQILFLILVKRWLGDIKQKANQYTAQTKTYDTLTFSQSEHTANISVAE